SCGRPLARVAKVMPRTGSVQPNRPTWLIGRVPGPLLVDSLALGRGATRRQPPPHTGKLALACGERHPLQALQTLPVVNRLGAHRRAQKGAQAREGVA